MSELGFEVETWEKYLYISSPLGTKVSVDLICRGCELKIYGILLTMDLRVMDMSEFDVILGMDWLTANQVVIDCERRRVIGLHTGRYLCYVSGGQARCFTPNRVRLQMARTIDGLASKPYPGGQGETGLGSTSGTL